MSSARTDLPLAQALEETETVGYPGKPRRIYAYSTPDSRSRKWTRTIGHKTVSGTGSLKVGETSRPAARERIKEQLGTAFPDLEGIEIPLDEPARRKDGSYFGDHDVHHVLKQQGIRRIGGEWFEATLEEVKAAVVAVRNGAAFESSRTEDFPPRPEQEEAIAMTAGYFRSVATSDFHGSPRFLWNAKMRFGKTFTAYQLAREMGWSRLLVLTYKPAVQAAWHDDLLGHVDFEGWHFVDRSTPTDEADGLIDGDQPVVWFASFQDLKGTSAEGDVKDRNQTLYLTDWDCIILDEYHFGAWRDSARDMYDPGEAKLAELEEPDEPVTESDLGLRANHYLYLSGTPFRAITNGEFTEDQVFNWTYPDEQSAKAGWDGDEGPNPYVDLPEMNLYCYEVGQQALGWASDGEYDGFSLSDYFRASRVEGTGNSTAADTHIFEDAQRVDAFLDLLRGDLSDQMKLKVLTGRKAPFPYEAATFAEAVRHSVWFLPDVASCYAMKDRLAGHPGFKEFVVHVAAGGRAGMGADAKPPVVNAIAKADAERSLGSITLTCGKLMTGVTVPQWGAIFMLRTLNSPETYFQAAFRVQSPWRRTLGDGSVEVVKPKCLVFEFDPNRALHLLSEYAIKLAGTGGDSPDPRKAVEELINFLPIFGFRDGEMLALDATEILDTATAGVGAKALARRWNSPLLVNVNELTLAAVLDNPDLMETLDQVEDFRALVDNAHQVVTSTKALKKAKREQSGELDPEQKKLRTETNKQRKEIREKLQKFLAKVPVFMYSTDRREEALIHVIEAIEPRLFEKVTGLTIADFHLLSEIGVFNVDNMNQAIFQFRMFERRSLEYAEQAAPQEPRTIGLWNRTDTV